MRQRGSVSIVVAASLAFVVLLAGLSADLSRAAGARARAQAAADAGALAAAQELVAPSGTPPSDVAALYVERNGARLAGCRCEVGADEAVVTVEVDAALAFLSQTRTVSASARAVVTTPSGAEGLQPFFAARLSCLFAAVPGLWIVSGFRTRAEQATLYEQKPGLAAPPGHSNHELGLAADLGYPSDGAEDMAHVRAAGCGLSFPVPYEPWHVEPAGI